MNVRRLQIPPGAVFDCAPDILLPVQFFNAKPWSGEKRLMGAILLDAVKGYRRRTQEATRWFHAEPVEPEPLYSFHNICLTLGLSRSAILAQLAAERGRRVA